MFADGLSDFEQELQLNEDYDQSAQDCQGSFEHLII
jgi:hypothetical protein